MLYNLEDIFILPKILRNLLFLLIMLMSDCSHKTIGY